MALIDIFNNDAFSMTSMLGTVEKMPYSPGLLGAMGLFRKEPVRTESVAIESVNRTLAIIQTSPRGAPLEQATKGKRNIRRFDTVRLAKSDTIRAAEIQGIRDFGSETELMQVQDEVIKRQIKLRGDMELTHELHRLGAIQGKVLDADGTVIYNWFTEWQIAPPTPIEFHLDIATTDVEQICRDILRDMWRASQNAMQPGSYVGALCGDAFFDKLTKHKTVRETYLNAPQATLLGRAFGLAAGRMDGSFATFMYGGILFINYRGTDSFNDGAASGVDSIGIKSREAKFFPINAPGIFEMAMAPGESFNMINQPGREIYPLVIPDMKRQQYVDVEIYSYPLFICTRPDVLMSGIDTANP